MIPFLSLLLWLAAEAVILACLFAFFGRLWWCFDLLSHFRLQYFLCLVAFTLCYIPLKEPAGALLCAAFALFNLSFIWPIYRRTGVQKGGGKQYRLVLANILGHNQSYEKITAFLREVDADLVVLIEARPHLMEALRPLLGDYPHSFYHLRDDNFGLVLLSRLPLQTAEVCYFGDADLPSIIARLELDGVPLTVIGTHPHPPKRRLWSAQRDRQMAAIASFVAGQSGEVLLAGDLNMTSWSHSFRDILQSSHLQDSRQGFGLQPTWPLDFPLLLVPIDHILHSKGITIHSRRLGSPIGSDHLPVVLNFNLESGSS